ncbi:potassium-transporting ATPase subunit KdpB, partial [Pseudomonas aeruginosa]|nr:potassium-transporting ATPase subunit KdpB [Pseudomonas aeruginosa]
AGAMALASEIVEWFGLAPDWVVAGLALLAILGAGLPTYRKGWIALKNRNLNINALMSIAVTGAVLIGQWPEAAMVSVLFAIAELIEAKSLDRARNAIRGLLQLAPEQATVLVGGEWKELPAKQVELEATVRVKPGERIALDGEVTSGRSSVNQAPITGESLPVEKEVGEPVFAGSINGEGALEYRVTRRADDSTLARIIHAVEEAQGSRAPTQRFVDSFARVYTPVVFLIALATAVLPPLLFGGAWLDWIYRALVLLVIACPCALVISTPVTIVSGLSAAARLGILIKGGVFLELGRKLSWVALDKTGTITFGNRRCSALYAAPGVSGKELAEGALLASLADDTPEGKSIVEYLRILHPIEEPRREELTPIAFSAETRLSGVDWNGQVYRKGAVDAALRFIDLPREKMPEVLSREVDKIAQSGGTPLLVVANGRLLGAIHLKDVVKPGIRERFAELRRLGIRTVMVTGDNPLTAAAIAAEAGVDDVIAEATPEKKLARIRQEQGEGRLVAMCGDGANDAPALAQADVGMAMNDGTQAAREAANLVDLDSDPTKLLDVVQVGKELLVTRGALTTFSIANDVAKYFAILPALFVGIYPQLDVLNVMRLQSPQSAILSAIVFNALIIVALIPLALRGVRVQAADASQLLQRNLLIYGVGGLVAPFLGIKAIDLLLTAVGLA